MVISTSSIKLIVISLFSFLLFAFGVEVLRTTCKVYGIIFLVLFFLYLLFRDRYTKIYNIKKSYDKLNTPVAEENFGAISWMWKVFTVKYDQIIDECGMDAATTIRLVELGAKLSFVGVICSIFLFPSYKYGNTLESMGNVTDPMDALSLSNVPSGDNSAIAATFGAYILFGAAMYFIMKDLEWFQNNRRSFLSRKVAENYSLFMSGLPKDLQNDAALTSFFADQNVREAHVALKIANLEKDVAKRDALVPKFDHAINVRVVKGEEPMHKTKMCCGGEKVQSIPTYDTDLGELNDTITKSIDKVLTLHEARNEGDSENPATAAVSSTKESLTENEDVSAVAEAFDEPKKSGIGSITSSIKAMMTSEDGATRDAAFISFSDLTSTNLALQAIHHHTPWVCDVQPAPRPDQVEWKHVGVSTKGKQLGELISLTLTVLLCLFWTIPVGFVASLANVESLTELLPFLKPIVEEHEWFGALLAQLAPLILVVFISLLPVILLAFVGLEKHISIASYQHPSLFNKVCAFTIIQTFFISTISGSITSKLQEISNNPASAVELLATALPAQASYFIQVILVQNWLGLGTELLRVSPIVQSILRHYVGKFLGYDLTDKERSSSYLGLRVFSDPLEYYFGRKLGGETMLIYMVLFVYAPMAPISCYFTLLIFVLLAMGYRNQFIYIYPIANDSGGTLYLMFVKIMIICMIVAEIVLIGVLALKQAPIAVGLLVPLIVVTILFNSYLKKKHYYVTRYLPTEDCAAVDRKNSEECVTLEFLKDAYLQPALKVRSALPENYDEIEGKKRIGSTDRKEDEEEVVAQ